MGKPKSDRNILSAKLSLHFSNQNKIALLIIFFLEYKRVCQQFIDLIWDLEDLPSLLPIEITSQVTDTWLSKRMIQACGKQASAIVRGTKRKSQKLKKAIHLKIEEGKNPNHLIKKLAKMKVSKPSIKSIEPELDSRFWKLEEAKNTSFPFWLILSSIGDGMEITLPVKGSEPFDKLKEKGGEILGSIRVSKDFLTVNFEMPEVEKRETGTVMGIDVGVIDPLYCSDGQTVSKDKHGWTLNKILDRLSNRERGSQGFKEAKAHRQNFIGWMVKQVNFNGVRTVNVESLNFKKRNSRKLSHWTYGKLFERLEAFLLTNGVRIQKVNPAYSSQRCSSCGWTHSGNRSGKLFKCGKCGFAADADFNASLNLSTDLPEFNWKWREKIESKGMFLRSNLIPARSS